MHGLPVCSDPLIRAVSVRSGKYIPTTEMVTNGKVCNFALVFIELLLLNVLTNAPVGVTVDNRILKILRK